MNIQDLSILLAAVELAVKRGTFSIFEIGAVGQTADKLAAFLKDANEQAEAAKAAAEAQQQDQESAPTPEADQGQSA
jgi:thiamine pyrophosphokinase